MRLIVKNNSNPKIIYNINSTGTIIYSIVIIYFIYIVKFINLYYSKINQLNTSQQYRYSFLITNMNRFRSSVLSR